MHVLRTSLRAGCTSPCYQSSVLAAVARGKHLTVVSRAQPTRAGKSLVNWAAGGAGPPALTDDRRSFE